MADNRNERFDKLLSAMAGDVEAPPPPRVHLGIGVTGHRGSHPDWAANRGRIEAALALILGGLTGKLGNATARQ